MGELVHSPVAGVFAQRAEPSQFVQAFIEYGVVTWPGEIDLAPDAMYQNIKQNGKWILHYSPGQMSPVSLVSVVEQPEEPAP